MFLRAATLLLFSTCTVASAVSAQASLPADTLSDRLSVKLTGAFPSEAERERFRQRLESDPARRMEILDQEILRYMQKPQFFTAMDRFHAVWFRVAGASSKNAAYVVSNDRPFTELFNRDYLYLSSVEAQSYRQLDIKIAGDLPNPAEGYKEVRLASDEPRFRSILSNLDLLTRYPDTRTNRNRSRANFIFQAFLCETLSPQDVSLAHLKATFSDDDQHGTDPDCMGCHFRLDPMARFFDRWPPFETAIRFDAAAPAAGTVVIPRPGHPADRYSGFGENDLARLLAERPEAQSCIASKAWSFVFGNNIAIPPEFKDRLTAAFTERMSFRDAIRTAMSHPYFWSATTPPPITYNDIAPILTSCGSCHAPGRAEAFATVFDPSTYPYRAESDENAALLARVYGAINHRNGFMPMPRAPRPQLPPESLAKIREWIQNGALDANETPTLSMDEIERVLDE